MLKKFCCFIIISAFVFTLCGCGFDFLNPKPEGETIYVKGTLPPQQSEAVQYATQVTEETAVQQGEATTTQAQGETEVTSTTQPPQTTVAEEPQTTEIQKTGDMAFSDDPENKFISAVSSKYNVKAENLAVLYTVPENDANTVLEFDGSKDGNGKLIRTEDTLIAIYTIDASLNSKCASKDKSKNEYPYGEMMVMFMSVTSYIMPEFQAELNG